MSSITYLQLDANYDPIFDPRAALQDLQAVEQAIKTRVLLFEGEWWEDLNIGTPMFQEIIGARATPSGQQIMAAALSARIAGTPFVSTVQNISTTFNSTLRKFSFSATADTSFGAVSVQFGPAVFAGSQG